MLIDFDSAKNAANIAKHGLPLSFAVYFDWGLANLHDDRREVKKYAAENPPPNLLPAD